MKTQIASAIHAGLVNHRRRNTWIKSHCQSNRWITAARCQSIGAGAVQSSEKERKTVPTRSVNPCNSQSSRQIVVDGNRAERRHCTGVARGYCVSSRLSENEIACVSLAESKSGRKDICRIARAVGCAIASSRHVGSIHHVAATTRNYSDDQRRIAAA